MVCGNQEELGAHIRRVVSPRLDIDVDMIFLEFTQIFASGECPECQSALFFSSTCRCLRQFNVPCRMERGGSGGSPPGNPKME